MVRRLVGDMGTRFEAKAVSHASFGAPLIEIAELVAQWLVYKEVHCEL
jgi:hypothetical protein